MNQSELNILALHRRVRFTMDFNSSEQDNKVPKGTEAVIVGIIPPTGIAGYHESKTPVVLIDRKKARPFTVHEDFVELV